MDAPAPLYIVAGGSVNTLVARGGTGVTLAGGTGGAITVHNHGVSDGFVQTTGAVNTAFAVPTPTNVSLGKNPKTISGNTVFSVGSGLTAEGGSILGDDALTNATGLHVLPGVSLTLNPNWNTADPSIPVTSITVTATTITYNYAAATPAWVAVAALVDVVNTANVADNVVSTAITSTTATSITVTVPGGVAQAAAGGTVYHAVRDMVSLGFSDGVLIEGTLATGLRDGSVANAASIAITAANVVCLPNSTVSVSGLNNPGGAGGTAGPLNFYCYGSVVTQGNILAVGGNGNTGGASFGVGLYSVYWGVFNTGNITTSGGTGATGLGGPAGVIYIINSYATGSFTGGGAFNSGTLTAVGGSGATGGANGGYIDMAWYAWSDGPLVISGTLNTSGGDCTGATGPGGNAGPLDLNSLGGHVRFSATIIARGGNGTGAGNGGNGTSVAISGNNGGSPSIDQPVFDGAYIGGSIDTSGGTGATGGNAGSVDFWDNAVYGGPDGIPQHSPIYVVGYSLFDTSGGMGATGGGNGGSITLELIAEATGGNPLNLYQGSMTNSVPLTSVGGQGLSGNGGNGGNVFIGDNESTDPTAAPDVNRLVSNSGTINTTGGIGSVAGGTGGSIYIYDRFNVTNSGKLTSSGGAGGTGAGGNANYIRIRSDGPTQNTATLTANGGASNSGTGGYGSSVFVDGYVATTSGTINDQGGNSATNTGGGGGNVEIGSWNGIILSSIAGTINVQGGTGATAGNVGILTVDGIRQALVAGSKTY
jgi:hypothetical protein